MAEAELASRAPEGVALGSPWSHRPQRDSGPAVARLFARALALVCLAAWVSLAVQLPTLVGERGLLPAGRTMSQLRAAGASFLDAPTLFWWVDPGGALIAGAALGALLSLLALAGIATRVCFALVAVLYLSYAEICGSFTAFQWDNMLVETTCLAALLPLHRPAPRAHLAFRLLLFKLYLESGIAKWQSGLHDWHDGSAMTFYFETAPIPTRLAWYAHQLPEWVHHLESWGALILELVVPLLIWGPRWARLSAFAAFTGFQIVNTATANYGFFTYLSLALHVFLLRDADVARARRALWLLLPQAPSPTAGAEVAQGAAAPGPLRGLATLLVALYAAASLAGAMVHFSRGPFVRETLAPLYHEYRNLRVVNVYHLFGHITRERIEPELQTRQNGEWTAHDLRYKPGEPTRAPPLVAPHQPRVDFRLWFYGLGFRRGAPPYVRALLARMCEDPPAVQPLFDAPLPKAPEAVRIAFHRYHFTTPEQKRRSGAYWRREPLGASRPLVCQRGATR